MRHRGQTNRPVSWWGGNPPTNYSGYYDTSSNLGSIGISRTMSRPRQNARRSRRRPEPLHGAAARPLPPWTASRGPGTPHARRASQSSRPRVRSMVLWSDVAMSYPPVRAESRTVRSQTPVRGRGRHCRVQRRVERLTNHNPPRLQRARASLQPADAPLSCSLRARARGGLRQVIMATIKPFRIAPRVTTRAPAGMRHYSLPAAGSPRHPRAVLAGLVNPSSAPPIPPPARPAR